jgi:hypothetical protein
MVSERPLIARRRGFDHEDDPPDITARRVQRMNLLLLMLRGLPDLPRTILFNPDPFRRLLRSSVRYAGFCSSSNSCQRAQVIRMAMTRQRGWTALLKSNKRVDNDYKIFLGGHSRSLP